MRIMEVLLIVAVYLLFIVLAGAGIIHAVRSEALGIILVFNLTVISGLLLAAWVEHRKGIK